uniref:Transposase n=1 Tax=Heteroscytonema crispum UCFS15 TaxID=1123969 RepID=A0A3G2KSQ4_9CYAN|nr:transposase [Heteroscytonema crispum UCFS15]
MPTMKNHIYSTFKLSKSLSQFQEKVTKLLELTNISDFDVQGFKFREEKIRESALVLAGECIALLLNDLSNSQEFLDKAMQQTQGWWHEKTQRHGYKKRQILTVGNVEVSLKLPYVVERGNPPNKNKQYKPEGFCPFLKYLGISESLTPVVLSTVVQYGAIAGSFEAARTTLIDWGINISLKRIQRLTYYFGQLGIDLRNHKINDLESGKLSALNTLFNQRVVIAVDGGCTRIRINKKGRRKVKTNRRGFTGEWIEPKLLTIYTVNEQGKKVKTSDIPITNDGTYEGYEGFLKILEMYLVHLGISQAKQVLLIADGA